MGYIIALGVAAVVAVVVLVGLFWSTHKVHREDRAQAPARPAGRPSADAPTPDSSVIETPAQIENARKRTPPA